jgi:hypothetical protein
MIFTPSVKSPSAIGTGGAGRGVVRAAIERACVHPDRGSACLIPNSFAFMSLLVRQKRAAVENKIVGQTVLTGEASLIGGSL